MHKLQLVKSSPPFSMQVPSFKASRATAQHRCGAGLVKQVALSSVIWVGMGSAATQTRAVPTSSVSAEQGAPCAILAL